MKRNVVAGALAPLERMSKPMQTTDIQPTQTKAKSWGQRCHAKLMEKAKSKQAFAWMLGVSFAESSIFPFPPDWLMIPMIIADRNQAWRMAFWCTVASVLGGIVGYALGAFLWSTVGAWVIQMYSLESSLLKFQEGFAAWGFWIIIGKGLTPIPYKLVTIASGMACYPFGWFVVASVIARSFRFFLLAGLLKKFGPQVQHAMERYFLWLFGISLFLIFGGVYVVKHCIS